MLLRVGAIVTDGGVSESLVTSGKETERDGGSTTGGMGLVQDVNTQRDRNMEGYNVIDWKDVCTLTYQR